GEPPHTIDRERWSGLCGEDVCFAAWREIEAGRGIAVTVKTIDSDDVRAYVEIYVDGMRSAEGPIDGEQTFTALVGGPGWRKVEVRLANPITRNSRQRRVRITALQTL